MERQRIGWLDVAKGITIFLMILGHTSIPSYLSNFIFAFHMPLFFIASGWCTNWDTVDVPKFIKKKLRSLILPFVIYSTIVILISYLIDYQDVNLEGVLLNGWQGIALWFVPVLFFALIMAILVYMLPMCWMRLLAYIALVILAVVLKHYKVNLPWTLSTVPYATFLVLSGSYLKRYANIINKPRLLILIPCVIVTIVISHNWRLDLAWNRILPVIPLTLGAFSGTAMTFLISSYIDMKTICLSKILKIFGKETFVILAFSQILGFAIQYVYPCNKIAEYIGMFALLFVIAVIKNKIKKITTLT